MIRQNDVGSISHIRELSTSVSSIIYEGEDYELSTQFRCSGASGFINWLDNVLQIRETANYNFDNYEFEIVDDPNDLTIQINRIQTLKPKCTIRIVAGYA
ncbi:unnamed protein product [Didymodactylos carnosus]|uniref:Schlafen group 3-like DNA/RNA helicase domain-containing protein n=1 Tax=Didymodactylos carnosus TaxID=1234261 RepID=A0A8S2CWW0_9BILA|nr:unnamed protein product [Didymodactylos carnosus]CAF3540455.1 unnamed protein product [Didymodactylos carnosus]